MSSHQGNIIEKIIRREGHSLTDVAKALGVNRRSIYNWFLQPRLKPEIIIRIGQAVSHDFSIEFPALFVSADFNAATADAMPEEINIWKEKYLDLLERYNFLLEHQQRKLTARPTAAFNVMFVNDDEKEYNLDLQNYPSALFLQKCRKFGYRIKSINRAGVNRTSDPATLAQQANLS